MPSTDPSLEEQSHRHSLRRIDHLVLAGHDLAALADLFKRLGFTVGARNRHPWGTQNHIVQFDGCFIELIGVDPTFQLAADHDPHNFSFSGFIGSFLKQGEGGSMIGLTSDNAEADTRAFAVLGIGDFEPFHFERRGKRPDGSPIEVAFTLAFARSDLMPEIGYFSCQHHFPQNFWDPAFQAHPNSAASVEAIVIVAENPADHGAFLSHLTGVRSYAATSRGLSFELGSGGQRIEVLTPHAFRQQYGEEALLDEPAHPVIAGCVIGVADNASLIECMGKAKVDFRRAGDMLVIDPHTVPGLAIAFRKVR
jgi:hypothetical protein